jgi:hypothetical protein
MQRTLSIALWLVALGAQAQVPTRTYELDYRIEMQPEAAVAVVTVSLSGERLPSRLEFTIDPQRHRNFRSKDALTVGERTVSWSPHGKRSQLRYEFAVNHERSRGAYDSLLQGDWAIFRGDKLVPAVKVTALKGMQSKARISFVLPKGWSVVTTQGNPANSALEFDQADRRFDRPTGWILAGKLGRRVERIAGVTTTVAAPVGEEARRQDALAFLNWNLPRLVEVFPGFPKRLLIVTAGDPMWRGGLSGPSSLFIHSDRPLISENRTSTLLHELTHVAMGIRASDKSDWIVEGFAEYYSLEILRRSGGISESRYREALKRLEKWSRGAHSVRVDRSTGAVTAKAVVLLKAADTEIRRLTRDKHSLDDVAAALAHARGRIAVEDLQREASRLTGRDLESFANVQ